MIQKFNEFLKKLENSDNKALVEAIKNGFSIIMEGYANAVEIRPEKINAIDRFNREAADLELTMGNSTMHKIREFTRSNAGKFSEDEESELDNNPTSAFRQIQYSDVDPQELIRQKDELTDSLGLTRDEIIRQNR